MIPLLALLCMSMAPGLFAAAYEIETTNSFGGGHNDPYTQVPFPIKKEQTADNAVVASPLKPQPIILQTPPSGAELVPTAPDTTANTDNDNSENASPRSAGIRPNSGILGIATPLKPVLPPPPVPKPYQ